MSGNGILVIETVSGNAGREAYALTDEQILGMEGEEVDLPSAEEGLNASRGPSTAAAGASARDDRKAASANESGSRGRLQGAQPGMAVLQEPPKWLAREMNDPWVGDEARELWEGVQRAQREAADYRAVIGSPEDARALREIYPGGAAEARGAAERAKELAEIDAAIFGAPGRGAEELRAGRVQLVKRLYAQDPGAFREMVEAGVRLLGGAASGQRLVTSAEGRELNAEAQRTQSWERNPAQMAGEVRSTVDRAEVAQAGVPVPQEVASAYREFETAANAELERSVGGAIGRALEEALPNLRRAGSLMSDGGPRGERPLADRGKQAASLQERLQASVKEEVEASLRSDSALGEQVARVLSGKRFDEAARTQVVRLIDARARQLVPGAVRKVVGGWTAATLGTKRHDSGGEERKSVALTRSASGASARVADDRAGAPEVARKPARGRVDYRKWSDEQILEM